MHMRNTIVCALLVFGTQYAWGQSACQQALTNIQKLNSQASQPGMPSSDVAAFRQSAQVYQNFYNANCQGRSGTSSGFGSVPSGSNARLNALQGILGNMANMAATLQASQERQEAEARQRQMQAEFDQMEREQQERQRKLETQRETAAAEHRAREAARAAEIAKAEADRQEALAATEDARQRNVDVKFGSPRPEAGPAPEGQLAPSVIASSPFARSRAAPGTTGNRIDNGAAAGGQVIPCKGYPGALYLRGSSDCFLQGASPQKCDSLGGWINPQRPGQCFFVPPNPQSGSTVAVAPLSSPFAKTRGRTAASSLHLMVPDNNVGENAVLNPVPQSAATGSRPGDCEGLSSDDYYDRIDQMLGGNAQVCGMSSQSLTSLRGTTAGKTATFEDIGYLSIDKATQDILLNDGAVTLPRVAQSRNGDQIQIDCRVPLRVTTQQESYIECARVYLCASASVSLAREIARANPSMACAAASGKAMESRPIPTRGTTIRAAP